MALVSDNPLLCRRLIEAGARIKEHDDNLEGMTPLHKAAQYNAAEVVQFLVDSGADMEAVSWPGLPALFYTPARNATDAAIRLLDLGANAFRVLDLGQTFLHRVAGYAGATGLERWSKVPIRGLDAAARDRLGRTARDCFERRRLGPEAQRAYEDLEKIWCSPVNEGGGEVDDDSGGEDEFYDAEEGSDGEDEFHDAVEVLA